MNIRKLLLLSTLTLIPQLSLAENIIRANAPIFVTKEKPTTPMTYGSCLEIKKAKPSSASGVHTIKVHSIEFPVYCDMTSAGGGWTMVVAQFEADPVTNWNEGRQGDYDPSLASKRGFALSTSEIPTHTQTAFGKDFVANEVDYVNFKYTTGEIPKTLVIGAKGQYHAYRSNTYHHGAHNPEEHIGLDGGAGSQWSRTLTFDLTGGRGFSWAFSPVNSISMRKGYALNGYLETSSQNYAWTVWVR